MGGQWLYAGPQCKLGHLGSPPSVFTPSSGLDKVCSCGRRERKHASTHNWHTITSVTFYWPQQVMSSAQIQVVERRNHLSMRGGAESHCKGAGVQGGHSYSESATKGKHSGMISLSQLPLPIAEVCGSPNWQVQPCSVKDRREIGKKEERAGLGNTPFPPHPSQQPRGFGGICSGNPGSRHPTWSS